MFGDRGAHLVQIVEGDVVEAFHDRAEALEISLGACRGQGGEAAAVERAVAADHPIALRVADMRLVLAGDLDRQLDGLGPRIIEEYGIGEAVGDQPLGETLLSRDLEQVRNMPEFSGLLGNRLDQARVAVAERGDRDAAREIEKFAAVRSIKIASFAPLGGDVPPGIGRHDRCNHRHSPARQICGYSDQAGFFDAAIVVAFRRAALLRRCCSGPARVAGIAHEPFSSPRLAGRAMPAASSSGKAAEYGEQSGCCQFAAHCGTVLIDRH